MKKAEPKEESFDIVPVHLAVKAMRDNGYKNAAYAIAELMDNSIQAGAKNVELLCIEQQTLVDERARGRIHQLGVLDDGIGMDASILRIALQFGNGTRLVSGLDSGIGRFGMGLPSASISQCTRVDVWSWRDGVKSAVYTYLDLDEVTSKRLTEVPKPVAKSIPDTWKKTGRSFGKTGTLVVWSNIDRCAWRSARAIIDNSEFIIGRMYRRFIHDDRVSIRLAAFESGDLKDPTVDRPAMPNDPLYLMAPTSTPAPWDDRAMFQEWGTSGGSEITIRFRNKNHKVRLRFSYASEEARPGRNPGEQPHGKHAKRNIGVSVMRAGRELELDSSWVIQYDPIERWWGAEVEFGPGLDELFGVTNNKQHAHYFAELGGLDLDAIAGRRTIAQVAEEMQQDGDPRGPLLEIKKQIESNLKAMRGLLRAQSKGKDRDRRHNGSSAEARGTEITRERQRQGHAGGSDAGESLPDDQRKNEIEKTLAEAGVTKEQATELAASTVDIGLKYVFATADIESPAFFTVKPKGGSLIILLNSQHPAYDHLIETLDQEHPGGTVDDLTRRLIKARDGLKLLLEAWARYEDEQPDGKRKEQAQDVRQDWGRMAKLFLGNSE